jgi:tyrosinase
MATQESNGPSFEGPHGWLHVTVGGSGHMTDVGYSAFDPIFWLHHTNVDRLLAMWQAIYPNSFMSPGREPGGNWFLTAGQTINKDTWLVPFFGKDGKTAWTTERARHPKTFGYSYPDVLDWQYTGTNAASRLSAAVTQRVNNLYNLNGRSGKLAMRGLERRDTPHEWTADVSAPNAALGGASFTVSLFLGEKPADGNQWPFKSIGALYVLATPTSPVSGPMVAHTEIILTQFMEDAGIDSSNITAGKEFLDKTLTWGVQKFDGTVIPNEEFEGLNIVIEDDVVKLPTSDTQLPKYSDKTIHEDITPAILSRK